MTRGRFPLYLLMAAGLMTAGVAAHLEDPMPEKNVPAAAPIDDEARDIIKDEFTRDLAEVQRSQGQMPTAEENARTVAEWAEGFEQRHQERIERAAMASAPPCAEAPINEELHQKALADEAARRGRAGLLERAKILRLGPDTGDVDPTSTLPPKIQLLYIRMQRRIDLLLEQRESGPLGGPSWRDRVMAVMSLRAKGAPAAKVAFHMKELLAASETAFGPWNVETPRPVHFI